MFPRSALFSALLVVSLGSAPALFAQTAPGDSSSRFQGYVDWLADDARQGRGSGTAELDRVGLWLAQHMQEIGLEPGHGDCYLQPLEVAFGGESGTGDGLEIDGAGRCAEDLTPISPTRDFNVVGWLSAAAQSRLPGVVVVGAHYDHLGYGGPNSLDTASQVIHNGADDNASGIAALLLVARRLLAQRQDLRRDIYFVAFTGEESGNRGSSHFIRTPPSGLAIEDVVAMLNMDMVGRLRDDTVEILGAHSAEEWPILLQPLCEQAALHCSLDGSGYGPSDHTPFYIAGAPVLHFFTGPHGDFHTSTDDSQKINADGGVRVARLVAATAAAIADHPEGLTYETVAASRSE